MEGGGVGEGGGGLISGTSVYVYTFVQGRNEERGLTICTKPVLLALERYQNLCR